MDVSQFLQVTQLEATGKNDPVRTFLLVLTKDLRDRDYSFAIDSLLDLEMAWKKAQTLK